MKQIAIVTGGNRGLGLGTCKELIKRNYQVILTSRNEAEGSKVAKDIGADFLLLDVSNPKSIEAAVQAFKKKYDRLDVLVNNAGILPEKGSAFDAKYEDLKATVETNTFGPLLLCQKFIPLMQKNNYGRVVNVSSGMGQLSEMSPGYITYRVSKTALNAVTKIFAEETRGSNILVNSICPGWVKTDMGGKEAARTIEQGVFSIMWAATLPQDGPTGGFFRDGKPLAW